MLHSLKQNNARNEQIHNTLENKSIYINKWRINDSLFSFAQQEHRVSPNQEHCHVVLLNKWFQYRKWLVVFASGRKKNLISSQPSHSTKLSVASFSPAPEGLLQCSGQLVKAWQCKLMFVTWIQRQRQYYFLEATSFSSNNVLFFFIQIISFEIALLCCLPKCHIAITHLWRPAEGWGVQTSAHYSHL